MPLLPCYPDDPWPEKLGAALLLLSDTGPAYESVHYPLRWDGNAYTQDTFALPNSGTGFTHKVTPICSQGEVVTMKQGVELSGGGSCSLNRESSEEVTCDSPDHLVGWNDLPKGCCQYSDDFSILEISIWGSGTIPDGIIPIENYTRPDSSSSSSSSSSGSASDGTLPRHLPKYVVNAEAYAQLAADPTPTRVGVWMPKLACTTIDIATTRRSWGDFA